MKHSMTIRQIFQLGLLVCLSLALLLPFAVARAEDEAVSMSMWIPYADSGKENSGNPPPPPPPPVGGEWAHFVDTQYNTNSASIVTDANGGIHLAFHYYEAANDDAPTYGSYFYCASACDKGESWQGVALGENVNEIQLALTAEGQPRLLYRVASDNNGHIFYYAECNSNCTQAAGWEGAAITSNRGMAIIEFSDDEQPQRYFALDPEGRPRFVYSDHDSFVEPDHLGTFYAYCDNECATASNWFEVQINKDNGGVGPYRSEDFYYPVLTFSPTGQPRVLADGRSMQDESALYYVACDNFCEEKESWHSAPLFARGSGNNVAYDLEINAQGQPRIAYFDGAQLNQKGEVLYYGWCNQACTDGGNWDRFEFPLGWKEGQEPDLELDSAGKPHIAYALYDEGGLGYSICTTDCESATGNWTHAVVESRNDLTAAWNVAYPPHCDGGLWDGLTPTLSLDKKGNATFAYDATYYARCWYNDVTRQWEVFHQFHLVQRSVRTYFLPKP